MISFLRTIALPATRTFAAIAVSSLVNGCGNFNYGIDLVNHGQHGVIIMKMSYYEAFEVKPYKTTSAAGLENTHDPRVPGLEGVRRVAHLYPSIPSQFRNPANAFGRFDGHSHSLPDEVEVVWQLAELSNCETSRAAHSENSEKWMRANGFDVEFHRIAFGCTWRPVPARIYRKKVDMEAIRASDAYKKAGRNFRLNLTFEFIEGELRVKPEAFRINRWS